MKPFFVAGLSALLLAATGLGAQNISRMLANTGLSPDDFEAMNAAASSLFENTTPRNGAQAKWKNPKSGSFGTVSLSNVADNCVGIDHVAHPQGAAGAIEISNRRCKATDGTWQNVAN